MNSGLLLSFLYFYMLAWFKVTSAESIFLFAILLVGILFAILIIGDLFFKEFIQNECQFDNLSTRVVVGVLILNALLYLLAILSPFGFKINFFIITVFVLFIYLYRWGWSGEVLFFKCHPSESIIFIVAPLLVALWCQDFVEVIRYNDKFAVLQVWQDVYYHLSQINVFASSHGAKTIFDVQMDGAIAHPYHHASYMIPALMVDVIGITSLTSYVALFVPFGILLTIFSSYSLVSSVFGKWPALASSLALLLLPDPFQLGFGNPYLSYHWILQISPAIGYGIASGAIAFAFLFKFCSSRRFLFVILGYIFVGFCLLHKAQIFIAISYVALIFPVIFLRSSILWRRFLIFSLLNFIYFYTISISQSLGFGPTLRLDASSLLEYSSIVISMQPMGYVRNIFEQVVLRFEEWRLFIFSIYLSLVTFGVILALYVLRFRQFWEKLSPVVAIYPFIALFVYLIMATFLAYDNTRTGAPEELLHRPFVWAYFIFIIWTVGGWYFYLFGNDVPKKKNEFILSLIICVFLLVIPFIMGIGVQSNRIWGKGYQTFPICKLNSAYFIRENSQKNDVVQDSLNDPSFMLSAFSERRPYAIYSGGFREPFGLKSRLNSLDALKKYTDQVDVLSFVKQASIGWYVVSPEGSVLWGNKLRDYVAYECGGYRVYKFSSEY